MNVGIQETGENDLAGAVHLRPALIASHAHDQTFRHGNVHGGQFIGEHVDKGGVFSTRSAGSRPAAAAMIRCFFSSFRLIFPA